jgi:uncharacterized protein
VAGEIRDATDSVNTKRVLAFVRGVVESLVDDPDAVSVKILVGTDGTILKVRVARADTGKVIGKNGRLARSLRTILSAISMKLHHRFDLDIEEDLE